MRRRAAARTIGSYRREAQRSDVTVTAIAQEGGPASAGLEFAGALLPLWDFPPGTGVAPAGEQGTNNRTFLVCNGQQRYVLRVSGFLSVAEVRAPPARPSSVGYQHALATDFDRGFLVTAGVVLLALFIALPAPRQRRAAAD